MGNDTNCNQATDSIGKATRPTPSRIVGPAMAATPNSNYNNNNKQQQQQQQQLKLRCDEPKQLPTLISTIACQYSRYR
jgi:hypothetical protein